MVDKAGRIVYGNVVAGERLGDDERPLLGRTLSEVLDSSGCSVAAHALAGGCTAWYLDEPPVTAGNDLEFALSVADALAGNLSLRRALARVVTLAVPSLGRWAGITLVETESLRYASLLEGTAAVHRTVTRRQAGPGSLALVEAAARGADEGVCRSVVDEGLGLTALGATAEQAAALLAGGPACLWTAVLRSHGLPLGVLTVAMAAPDGHPPPALAGLARRAGSAIATARAFEERSVLATMLRDSLVPPPMPAAEGLRFGAAYRAAQEASEMGGDFYDVRPEPAGWSITLGDVCGKGVEAAILTGQVRQALHTASLVDTDPVARLHLLNQAMLDGGGRSYVTLVHALVTPLPDGGSEVKVACGGHPAPLLRRRDGKVTEVQARGTLIGMMREVRFQPASIALLPGEVLVCVTDGLSEARGPSGHLGTAALARCLEECEGMGPQSIAERLLRLSLEHLDGRAHDDMAVLAVQADPAGRP